MTKTKPWQQTHPQQQLNTHKEREREREVNEDKIEKRKSQNKIMKFSFTICE